MDEPDQRRPSRLPARLFVGSLLGGAGLAVVGFFLGAAPAWADEAVPAPPPVAVAASVSGTVAHSAAGSGTVAETATDKVGALPAVAEHVAPAAEQAAPQPVPEAASPVVEHVEASAAVVAEQVTDAVADVVPIAATTIGAAVDTAAAATGPVTTEVVTVASSVPPVGDVRWAAPVSFVVEPVIAVVDGAAPGPLAAVGDSPSRVRAPFTPLPAVVTAFSAVSGWPTGPGSPPGAPGDSPGMVSGSAAGPGGASGSAPAAAVAARFFLHSAAPGGAECTAFDDRVPAAPVGDHDISPD